MAERFKVATRLFGKRVETTFWVYEEHAAMTKAAADWNGMETDSGTRGVTQAIHAHIDDVTDWMMPVVRLVRGDIDCILVAHEVAHAAQGLYGAYAPLALPQGKGHWHHGNEHFAHLVSDLLDSALKNLRRRGLLS